MLQLVPYVLVLRHLFIPLAVDGCDDVVVNLIDPLHDFAHLLLQLLQIGLTLEDHLSHAG